MRLPLARMVGSASFPQLAAVDEGLQNVLLGIVIVIDDIRHPLTELRQVLDVLVDAVVSDVIGSRLGSQQPAVTDVLLGETMAVMAANHRIGKIEIFDDGLQPALVLLGHLAAEDRGDLLRLADGTVHVQQALSELVHGGAPEKDQVVSVFGLGEEEPVLAAGVTSFGGGEEGSERSQPLQTALQQIPGGERVGQFLQAFRV